MTNIQRLKAWFIERDPLTQKRLLWLGIASVALLLVFLIGRNVPQQTFQSTLVKANYSGVSDARSPQEVWSEKISRQTEDIHKKFEAMHTDYVLLKKQLEILTQSMQALGKQRETIARASLHSTPSALGQESNTSKESPLLEKSLSHTLASPFETAGHADNPSQETLSQPVQESSLFGVLSLSASELPKSETNTTLRIVENTVPAGSHVQAVLTSAVAASTSTNSPNDPQPVTLRLMGDGNLPRGWKSSLKDAVLVGACYGDLSSERVLCRLTTLSWVEPNGEVIERDVEGWVVGEDGRYGIQGLVVDRTGEAARGSFISGVLSGIAGFFSAQSTAQVFPVSPLGQTTALPGRDMLSAAGANGVGKALDRLSEFYIKRAESMSPVLLVNPGRIVDVVFKKSLDLRGSFLRQRLSSAAEKTRKQDALRQDALRQDALRRLHERKT